MYMYNNNNQGKCLKDHTVIRVVLNGKDFRAMPLKLWNRNIRVIPRCCCWQDGRRNDGDYSL
jgi:hypothetical protein